MKRSIIILLSFLLTLQSAVCEYNISLDKQSKIRIQINIIFNKYIGKLENNGYGGESPDYYMKKINAFLQNYNEDDEVKYTIEYLNTLLKDYAYNNIEKCFRNESRNCFGSTPFDVKYIINYFDKNDERYTKMLDMTFLGYFLNSFDSKTKSSWNGFGKGLEELEFYKDYDNYEFFISRFYAIRNNYDDLYYKYKDSPFYRKALYVPSVISEECLMNPRSCTF